MCDFLIRVIPILLYILCALKMANKKLNEKSFWDFAYDKAPMLREVPKNEIIFMFVVIYLIFWIPFAVCVVVRWIRGRKLWHK